MELVGRQSSQEIDQVLRLQLQTLVHAAIATDNGEGRCRCQRRRTTLDLIAQLADAAVANLEVEFQ